MAHALDAAGAEAFTLARREFIARRHAVIAANPELQEREALKGLALTASMTNALKQRGIPEMTAHLGALTLKITYERWIDATDREEFNKLARRTLRQLQAANPLR